MPKLKRGRLSGVWGMDTHTAEELHEAANLYFAKAFDPLDQDDIHWNLRWSLKLRTLAHQKTRAKEHKRRN